jgi:hypothetical protein
MPVGACSVPDLLTIPPVEEVYVDVLPAELVAVILHLTAVPPGPWPVLIVYVEPVDPLTLKPDPASVSHT